MTSTPLSSTHIPLLDYLIDATTELSASAIRILLLHARDALANQGDSTLKVREAAELAGISESAVQKARKLLSNMGLISLVPFGRESHVRVVGLAINHRQQAMDLPSPASSESSKETNSSGTTSSEEETLVSLEAQMKQCRARRTQALLDIAREIDRSKLFAFHNKTLPGLDAAVEALQRKIDAKKTPTTPNDIEQQPGSSREEKQKAPPRQLTPKLASRIRSTIRRLEGISSPVRVFNEIEHQVTGGLYRDKDLLHAVNICLSLLRQGRWQTPWDYSEKIAA